MSNPLPGNPFMDEAARDDYETVDGIGNAHATLALAYEQRTANLIAVLGQVGEQTYEWAVRARDVPDSDEAKQLARYKSIGQQVEERLGLA